MNALKFTEEIDRYLADVRGVALELFSSGVLSEHCLNLAQQIANSRATKRALDRQQGTARFTLDGAGRDKPTQ